MPRKNMHIVMIHFAKTKFLIFSMPKMIKKPIYLDYNATCPIDPRVTEAMLPFISEEFGNPSSQSHMYGWKASAAIDKARKQVAQLIGAQTKDIFWTSGATESNNMAILGTVRKFKNEKCHIITSAVEHKAVLQVCEAAREWGADISVLPVNKYGQIQFHDLEKMLRPETKLISIMAANNEIGSLNPIEDIGRLAHARGILFHTDAAQAFGKIHIDVDKMNIDLLSVSGHKIYAPKGIGFLYVKKKNPQAMPLPLFFGGSQECGLRPGTQNVAGIVGLGTAAELAQQEMAEENKQHCAWRDWVVEQILNKIPTAHLNGHPTDRLACNLSFSFENLHSDIFALGLSGLALSSGSACTSGNPEPSHVLKAIGLADPLARATIRLGFGRFTTRQDLETAVAKILAMNTKNSEISSI